MLSPAAPWQGARETPVKSKWNCDRLLIALQSPYCHLLAVKQGPEERTILGCTWWLHWSHMILITYSRKVFLHPNCTAQHLELKQLELGLGCCDAESTQHQHSNRNMTVQKPPAQGRGEITHPDTFCCSWDSTASGREGCLFRVTSHHGEKTQWNESNCFVKSHGDRPHLRHFLKWMPARWVSVSPCLTQRLRENCHGALKKKG